MLRFHTCFRLQRRVHRKPSGMLLEKMSSLDRHEFAQLRRVLQVWLIYPLRFSCAFSRVWMYLAFCNLEIPFPYTFAGWLIQVYVVQDIFGKASADEIIYDQCKLSYISI